ncbi:MAG: GDSL-type esterase/lipase family protein [Myxococcota bacterium]
MTIASYFAVCVGLSLAPLPAWLKPVDLFDADDPVQAFRESVFTQPEAIPLPDQLDDQVQASGDPLLLEDTSTDEGPTAEVTVTAPEGATEVDASAWTRTTWKRPQRPRLERYAARLGLEAAPLERPCLAGDGSAAEDPAPNDGGAGHAECEARALDGFFAALERTERGEGPVRVVHFGDSLIASDKIADRVRMRMQERFGSSGRGFLLGKRFNQFQRGNRSGRGSKGWALDVFTVSLNKLRDRHFGFSGASFTAEKSGETLRFAPVGGSTQLDLLYLQRPAGGDVILRADETEIGRVSTRGEETLARVHRLDVPSGAKAVMLESTGPGARVFGLTLQADVPGITWSTLGLPGATSEVWLRPDEEEFVRLLAEHGPDLAVVMLGGNDGLMLAKKRTTAAAVERDLRAFLKRIRRAKPELDCLLVTPLEAVRAKGGGRLVPKPEVAVVIDVIGKVARTEGCGLWDMYASMGGKGSLRRWVKARLMLGDLIHPRSRGSDLLGEMMVEAIMEAYDAREGDD